MPKSSPEYVRVYQSVVDDPKFAGVYDDDHHFATWVRLLMAADALWPASCPLPANARKASVRALVEAGIVDVTGSRFRVRGLDAERKRRQSKARASADHRWSGGNADADESDSDRNAAASPSHSDRNAATRAPASARSRGNSNGEDRARDPLDDVEAWLADRRAGVPPGSAVHTKLAQLVDAHGGPEVIAAMGQLDGPLHEGAQYVYGAVKVLRPIPNAPKAQTEEQRLAAQFDARLTAAGGKS